MIKPFRPEPKDPPKAYVWFFLFLGLAIGFVAVAGQAAHPGTVLVLSMVSTIIASYFLIKWLL